MKVKEESERAALRLKKTKIMTSGPITARHIEGEEVEVRTDFLFLGSRITMDSDCSHEIRWLLLGRKAMKPRRCAEKLRHYFTNKGLYSQGYGIPSGHAQLWDWDHKESGMSKNWCFWTKVLEKTPQSPLDSKEIKPVNLKGDQPWIVTRRTDAEAEAPVFGSSDVNRRLIRKVPHAGKDHGQKTRASENKGVGRHHRCNERELGQTPGDGEGQGRLVCCGPWGHKDLDTTEWLNSNIDYFIQQ